MFIKEDTRKIVVAYCNEKIVPNKEYIDNPDASHGHPIEWFREYFSFITDTSVSQHLAEAYYQSRFMYKIMQGLRLTAFKKTAVLKFQIQQYASIYEALLDYTLDTYHKDKISVLLREEDYKPIGFLSKNASLNIVIDGKSEKVFACRKSLRKVDLKQIRIDKRTQVANELGIISGTIKEQVDSLYKLRHNIHILKAAAADYKPSIAEATKSFHLMEPFVSSIKLHIEAQVLLMK